MRHAIGGLVLGLTLTLFAQAELRHRYSFDDGTARDSVGEADGGNSKQSGNREWATRFRSRHQ